jgi:hypothetical protein
MRSAQLEAYVSRLVRELKTRGLEDARLVEEAREHLADAIEDGRRRGLSIDAAAHEAFDRFGAPEVLAAYIATEKEGSMNRLTVLLGTVWLRKWWIVVPSVLTAFVTITASYYLLPARFPRASIRVVSVEGLLREDERLAASDHAAGRLQISGPLSISSLEKLVADSGLSGSDINVNILAHDPRGGDIRAEGTVRVRGSKK